MADNHCGHFTCKWYDRQAEERCGAPSPEAVAAAGCPELSEEERRSTPPVADEAKPSEWARGYMRLLEDADSCCECGDYEGDGDACESEDTCGRFLRRCAIADCARVDGDAAGYDRGVRDGYRQRIAEALVVGDKLDGTGECTECGKSGVTWTDGDEDNCMCLACAQTIVRDADRAREAAQPPKQGDGKEKGE